MCNLYISWFYNFQFFVYKVSVIIFQIYCFWCRIAIGILFSHLLALFVARAQMRGQGTLIILIVGSNVPQQKRLFSKLFFHFFSYLIKLCFFVVFLLVFAKHNFALCEIFKLLVYLVLIVK